MFVNVDDFLSPPYELPDLGLTDNSFADFVETMEKELLNELLGKKLCKDFYAGFQTTPPIEARWSALALGGEYNYYEDVYYYDGIKSFMVPYIFAMWKRENYKRNAITGDAVNSMENAENISPSRSIADAYNKMSDMVGGPYGNNIDTLHGFLSANPNDYPNWRYSSPGYMNIWNIGSECDGSGYGWYESIPARSVYTIVKGGLPKAGDAIYRK